MFFTDDEYKLLHGAINDANYCIKSKKNPIDLMCLNLALKIYKIYTGKFYVLSDEDLERFWSNFEGLKNSNTAAIKIYVAGVQDTIRWIKAQNERGGNK